MADEEKVEKEREEGAKEEEKAEEKREEAAEEEEKAAELKGKYYKRLLGGAKKVVEHPITRKVGVGLGKGVWGMGAGAAVAGWAAYAGLQEVFKAFKDPGLYLFIFGTLFHFFGNFFVKSVSFKIMIGIIFLIYTALFIFQGRGLLLVILFLIWYFYYGRELNWGFFIVAAAIMVIYGAVFKLKNLSGETAGIVPILIFYLDLGLLSLLMVKFGLSLGPWTRSLILYIPWWGLFGLFLTKKEHFLISFLKFVGIAYLVIILLIGSPGMVQGAIKPPIPGMEEIAEAREKVLVELPKGENPFVSTMWCSFNEPAAVGECVDRRQAESRCGGLKKVGIKDEENEEYQKCVKVVKGEEVKLAVGGKIDPRRKEPLRIDFKKGGEFKSEMLWGPKPVVSAKLGVVNPREKVLEIRMSCMFKKKGENISGEVSPGERVVEEKKWEGEVLCKPREDLKEGKYKVEFKAEILDLETKTWVTRLFIGDKDEEERREIRTRFRDLEEPSWENDLAVLKFRVGDDLLVGKEDELLYVPVQIQNIGRGGIKEVRGGEVNLRVEGIKAGDLEIPSEEWKCEGYDRSGGKMVIRPTFKMAEEIKKIKSRGVISIGACHFRTSERLRNPEDYGEHIINVEFEGYIRYDYEIKEEWETPKVVLAVA